MADIKREYVIPLRRKTRKAPKWRRSKKAVSVLREFIRKHMKTERVVICNELNEKIWENGIKNPPGKVEVEVAKINVEGEELSIVNLKEVGVDKYVESYKSDKVKEKVKKLEEVEKKEDLTKENSESKDSKDDEKGEVKEIKEEKKEEKGEVKEEKSAKKKVKKEIKSKSKKEETNKKKEEESKKEVKKNE